MGKLGNATPQPLYPQERASLPTVQGAGWTRQLGWTAMKKRKYHAPNGVPTPGGPYGSELLNTLRYPGPSKITSRLKFAEISARV